MWRVARELTRALLARDFGICWSLEEGQLIPPVTNRCNYIHWLHDLLSLLPAGGMNNPDKAVALSPGWA